MYRETHIYEMVRRECRLASHRMRRMRTSSTQHARLIQAWSQPDVLEAFVTAGLGDWLRSLPQKVKQILPERAWSRVRGKLAKLRSLLRSPKIVTALSDFIGEVTPSNVRKFVKRGRKALKQSFTSIKQYLVKRENIPTLTEMLKRSAFGAGVAERYHEKAVPRLESLDAWLKKHMPTLSRAAYAAIFIFIWLNVDELSWDWKSLWRGFTGGVSLPELIGSLPESSIGFLTAQLFGIGFVIMPYVLAARISWLAARKIIEWKNGEWRPNWDVIDPERFRQAG